MATPADSHLCLYNREEFAELNMRRKGLRYVRFDHEDERGRLVGTLAGVGDGADFVSGFSAGFGGIDCAKEHVRLELVVSMIDGMLVAIRRAGFASVVIRAKPLHYSRNEHALQFALLRRGFALRQSNLNYYFDVPQYNGMEAYVRALKHEPRRQVTYALTLPLSWQEAFEDEQWAAMYGVLQESRRRRGAELSLDLPYILRLRRIFPKAVRGFVLAHEGEVVAACLLYVVRSGHAQVMYWGDAEQRLYRTRESSTPVPMMNLLAYRVVEQARLDGYSTVDLGPSTSADSVNFGNCVFKESVGAKPDFRQELTCTLDSR